MLLQKSPIKISIFIALALFFTLGKVFAETAKEALDKGIEYYKQERYEEAMANFNRAIEIDPDCAEAYYNRGRTYGSYDIFSDNSDQAIADFSKAIELDPNYVDSYVTRGTIYDSKGEYDRAISDYSKAIEIEPNNPEHYGSSRAWVYYHKGDYDKAWADVHKAELLGGKIDPDFLEELKKASGREN